VKMTIRIDMEEVMEIESTMGKGTQKPEDMNAPKKPMSAYFLWANKMRPCVMKEMGWGVADVARELSQMWKQISSDERNEYIRKYEKAKKKYDRQMKEYRKSANYKKYITALHAWKIHATKTPFRRDPNAPKRSFSAYVLYSNSVRGDIIRENPDMTVREIMKEQGVRWKALSAAKKKPWEEKAAEALAKYEKKLLQYQATSGDYQKYIAERDEYKAKMIAKRNRLMGIKKRARSKSAGNRRVKRFKRSSRGSKGRSPSRSPSRRRRRSSSHSGSSTSRASPRRKKEKRKHRRATRAHKATRRRTRSDSRSSKQRSASPRRARSAKRQSRRDSSTSHSRSVSCKRSRRRSSSRHRRACRRSTKRRSASPKRRSASPKRHSASPRVPSEVEVGTAASESSALEMM